MRHPSSSGFTLIELLVVIAIIGILAAMAVAGVRQARIRGAEAAAVASLNALNAAQFTYMQSCGRGRYAPTLVALGSPAPGANEGFVSPDLAASDPLAKSGYLIQLSGTPASEGEQTCTGLTPLDRYRLTADPVTPGHSGVRCYGTNGDRVIYEDVQSFAEDMTETGAPGHGAEIR